MPDGSGVFAQFVDRLRFGAWCDVSEDVDAAIARIDNAPSALSFLDAVDAARAQPAVAAHLRRQGRGWLLDEKLLAKLFSAWFWETELDLRRLPRRDRLLVAGLLSPDTVFADLLAGEH